jgi:hypothetical protein
VTSIHPVSVTDLSDSWSDMAEGSIREYVGLPYLGTSEALSGEWHVFDMPVTPAVVLISASTRSAH